MSSPPWTKIPTSDNNNDSDTTPSKMPSPDDDFHTFRSRDIELRKTAQFSDAQLIVGNAVWNVHKSIVCLRSGFFNKELSSLFRPGDVKSVTILNHTEEEVRLLLEFIYSGSK